jgi:DNA helicase-2/ATP-dependent DNA helicase PcrA
MPLRAKRPILQSSTVIDEHPNNEDPERTPDRAQERIVAEEQRCLDRVLHHLDNRERARPDETPAYDRDLVDLRDQIANARLEDVPPLIEQMERLQSLAARRRRSSNGNAAVDRRSPYFGHLVLEEGPRRREVFIGRSTYLDTDSGVRIVDWRDAPVSRLFYRYDEGDDYDEVFGDREVEGQVITRRSVSIVDAELKRINAPQGTFVRSRAGEWRQLDIDALRLRGGQGTATRAEQHHRPGRLGVAHDDTREDKHLREITALIDRRQFELITRPDSGLVVIQGGAGSGKTTIGLHRLAYLAYADSRRFRPDRMLVVVFNDALARYISMVLPALDVQGVPIRTYEDWAARARVTHVPGLTRRYTDETPVEATRLKKHPAMLRAIETFVAHRTMAIERELHRALAHPDLKPTSDSARRLLEAWAREPRRPLRHRLHSVKVALDRDGRSLDTNARVTVERLIAARIRETRDVVTAWAEVLTDRGHLERVFSEEDPDFVRSGDLHRAHAWCVVRCGEAIAEMEALADDDRPRRRGQGGTLNNELLGAPTHGVDGRTVEERAALDREDDTLLLRLCQRFQGPLMRGTKGKEALVYEHVLVDEAQDLSPVELAVVLDTVSKARSITLAGDVAQRLHMDNGFSDWKTVLGTLGLDHVAVEPLRLSYRSTLPIIEFSRAVLGPLATGDEPEATRTGAPVELFGFGHSGDAVGFLAEALRDLIHEEPRAAVAVVARYPEQADMYFDGLKTAEVPYVRRIAEQDFPFKPGIDVTDIRQVKGLEFDYVVLVEVSESAYPMDDEARHLLHIGATRAAHQLWVLTTSRPSRLLPEAMLERGY